MASNRSAAEQMEAAARLDLAAGRLPVPLVRPSPFAAESAAFLRWAADVEYRAHPNTAARLKTSHSSAVAFFGDEPVSAIAPPRIEAYKAWRIGEHQVRDVTVRHDLHALSVFFRKWALPRRLAASNPVSQVGKPSDREAVREHVLTAAEERAYFSAARRYPHLFDLARLMLLTGARPDELLSLPRSGVDLRQRTMTIAGGKTRAARRTLPLVDEAVSILRRRAIRPGAWIFPSDRAPGQHLTKLNNQHDEVCRLAKVSFRLYDLRHTYATRMLTQVGADIATVAALLGHSGLRVVARYLHPLADTQKAAVARWNAILRATSRTKTGTAG
jgi:integrase